MLPYNSFLPTLTTERLTLRELKESDASDIFLLRSNPTVNKYLEREPARHLEEAVHFILKIIESTKNKESFYWAITKTGTEKLIGTICLFDLSKEEKKCEIGYELLPQYQGQGIMREALGKVIAFAFDIGNVETIIACTHKDNQTSTNLLQKCNFKKTGSMDECDDNLILYRLSQ